MNRSLLSTDKSQGVVTFSFKTFAINNVSHVPKIRKNCNFYIYIQSQMGHALSQDQTESGMTYKCLHKPAVKIKFSLNYWCILIAVS